MRVYALYRQSKRVLAMLVILSVVSLSINVIQVVGIWAEYEFDMCGWPEDMLGSSHVVSVRNRIGSS